MLQLVSVTVFNLVCFVVVSFVCPIWLRWANLAIGLFGASVIAISVYSNWTDGCYSQPKVVEFTQGMTLCPGQSASFTVDFGARHD